MERKLTTLILLVYITSFVFAAPAGAPSSLSAAVNGSQIDLSWTGTTSDGNGTIYYNLYRDTDPGVTTGDANITFTTSTSFSDITAAAGTTYYYRVLAYDTNDSQESGLSNEDNATIPVDLTPPSTSVKDVNGDTGAPYWATTTDAFDLVINTGESGVECKWSDANSATYSSFGTPCSNSDSESTCNLGARSETTSANIDVFYNCKDSNDNATGGQQVTLGIDATNPTGGLTTTVSNDDVTVTFIGTDAHSGVAKFEVKVGSDSWVDKGASAGSHAFNNQSNGDHTYYLRVTDNAGNIYEESKVQNVDYTDTSGDDQPTGTPTIDSDTHGEDDDDWTTDDDPEFDWTSVSRATRYRYALNTDDDYEIDNDDDSNNNDRTKNYNNMNDGERWFHVAGCNNEGCGPTDHYRIRIDNSVPGAVPNIFGLAQSDGSIYLSWDVPIDNPDGENSGIEKYVIYRNIKENVGSRNFTENDPGVKKFDNITRTNYTDEDNLTQGIAYYYRIRAIDGVGNQGPLSAIKRVLLSRDACNVTVKLDLPKYVKAGELAINVEVSGGKLNDTDLKIKMPDKAFETLFIDRDGTSFEETFNIPEGISGEGTILIKGRDEDRIFCEKAFNFEVDSIKPVIEEVSPKENEKVTGEITISVKASDEGTGIKKVDAYVEGIRVGTLEEKDGSYEFNWNSNAKNNGNYKLEIRAEDKAGNKKVKEISIEVNNINEELFGEKTYSYNSTNIAELLKNAGVKEDVKNEAEQLNRENNPQRKLMITKTDNGLKAQIILTLTNTGSAKNMQLIEIIPKSIANNAKNITSEKPFSIIQEDPVIKFDLGNVAQGKEIEFSYIVANGLTEAQANAMLSAINDYKAPPVLLEASRANPIEITPLSDTLWLIFIIAIVLLIIVVILLFLGGGAFIAHRIIKKNGESGLQSEGLHTAYKGKTGGFLEDMFKGEDKPKQGKFAYKDDD